MFLERIPKRKNRKMPSKRIGRGYGSGTGGHTVGRGTKGQKSRSGHKSTVFFEGGNVPFFRRIPKYRGFNKADKIAYEPINLTTLEKSYKAGEEISLDSLREKGLVRKRTTHVKILGSGEVTKKLKIKDLPLSEAARDKILASGGSIK
jgi:large subunit ribosomal protein L15